MKTSSVYIVSLWIEKYRNICVLNLVLICILYIFLSPRSHYIVTLCRKTDFWISALLIIQCVKYGLFLPLFIINLEVTKLRLLLFFFSSYFLCVVRHTKCNIKFLVAETVPFFECVCSVVFLCTALHRVFTSRPPNHLTKALSWRYSSPDRCLAYCKPSLNINDGVEVALWLSNHFIHHCKRQTIRVSFFFTQKKSQKLKLLLVLHYKSQLIWFHFFSGGFVALIHVSILIEIFNINFFRT